jgi:hypothetical protein
MPVALTEADRAFAGHLLTPALKQLIENYASASARLQVAVALAEERQNQFDAHRLAYLDEIGAEIVIYRTRCVSLTKRSISSRVTRLGSAIVLRLWVMLRCVLSECRKYGSQVRARVRRTLLFAANINDLERNARARSSAGRATDF